MAAMTLRDRLLLAIMSDYGMFALNAFILVLSGVALWVMAPMLFDPVNNAVQLEDISEYFGVILIGYGVAVEERASFMEIFRLYPRFRSPLNDHIDHVCHHFGLCYLLLGLLMEICTACIKLPNTIVDTHGVEDRWFTLAALILLWNSWLMLKHCVKLLHARKESAAHAA